MLAMRSEVLWLPAIVSMFSFLQLLHGLVPEPKKSSNNSKAKKSKAIKCPRVQFCATRAESRGT